MARREIKPERVAFTVFRNNLAEYLEKIEKGGEVIVMNEKRGRPIVSLVSSKGKWVAKHTLPGNLI